MKKLTFLYLSKKDQVRKPCFEKNEITDLKKA